MTWPLAFDPERQDLCTSRVARHDGERQLETVRQILRRLETQPGLVLADEVGMGKTFVALSVALAAAVNDKRRRPVVIMVPPSLRRKWPNDWEVFTRLCLKRPADQALRVASAHSGLEFFKLLDDTPAKRARIIFLTHGAFQVTLTDPWVKLAIIRAALHGIHLGIRRQALPRFVATLIRTKSRFDDPELYVRLLDRDCARWKDLINDWAPGNCQLGDDPVPEAVIKVLERGDVNLSEFVNESLPGAHERGSRSTADRVGRRPTRRRVLRGRGWCRGPVAAAPQSASSEALGGRGIILRPAPLRSSASRCT